MTKKVARHPRHPADQILLHAFERRAIKDILHRRAMKIIRNTFNLLLDNFHRSTEREVWHPQLEGQLTAFYELGIISKRQCTIWQNKVSALYVGKIT